MAKQDKTDPGALPAAPRTFRGPRRERPIPPVFDNERDERAWRAEQDRLDRELAEAYDKYPPGSRLFVTTARGIPRRNRAGLSFTDKGRTEVEVIDLSEDQIVKVRTLDQNAIERLHKGQDVAGLEGVDGRTAARVNSGNVVTPGGAKSIAEDDGLVVFEEQSKIGDLEPAEKDSRISELEAENKSLRDTIAGLKRAQGGAGEGRPERLARTPAAGGGEFGGEEKKG